MLPLSDCIASSPFALSQEAINAFHSLKVANPVCTGPRQIPLDKTFVLFCTEYLGHATGVESRNVVASPVAHY
uniref:Uncharacterized protein n=1 Tax=Engystomops pustulosus TaxID=76066 RepID=A0AAV6YRA1_ENGPU|nr:hypothetical protein GDO81_020660 [Engystomops pustulosus]